MLHNFRSGFLRVVLCDDGTQSVVVHAVLFRELVGRPFNEAQLRGRDAKRGEDADENMLVIFCPVSDELERRFKVIQEGMHIW